MLTRHHFDQTWLTWSVVTAEATIETAELLTPPGAAYRRRWTVSALFQVMACRLIKQLHEPMLFYCQISHQEQTLTKFES